MNDAPDHAADNATGKRRYPVPLDHRRFDGGGIAFSTVTLAAIPVIGFWYAYTFEVGRLHFYGIPSYGVPITVGHVAAGIVGACILSVPTLVLAHIGYSSTFRIPMRPVGLDEDARASKLLFVTELFMVQMALLTLRVLDLLSDTTFICIVVLVFVPMALVMFTSWVPRTPPLPLDFVICLFLSVIVLFGACSAHVAGTLLSRYSIDYLVLDDDPNYVLVNTYGDRNVFVEFDDDTKRLTGNVLILKDAALHDRMLTRKHVGPLKAARLDDAND